MCVVVNEGVLRSWIGEQKQFNLRFCVFCEASLSERFYWLPGLKNYFPGHVLGIRIITRQTFISWVSTRPDSYGLNN